HSMSSEEKEHLAPDIVISLFGNYVFNGELKKYLQGYAKKVEHWDIGKGKVCDPFRALTTMFELDEAFFFKKLGQYNQKANVMEYYNLWNEMGSDIIEPQVEFGELYAIGELVNRLPKCSSLFIANSLPIRMVHLFNVDQSIN